MSDNQQGKEPKILWGEHRTSEPLAMDIRSRLQEDPNLKDKIPFIEYEKFDITDYTERLYRREEMEHSGLNQQETTLKMKELKKDEDAYELKLNELHGPLVFNLHDGYQRMGVEYDIEFRLPNGIEDTQILIEYLQKLAVEHNLRIRALSYEPTSFIKAPNSIIVEFMTPLADEISSFPSDEIEKLAKKHDPMDAGARDFIDYKIADRNNPEYKNAVNRYSSYMRDVIIGLSDVRIS